MDFQNHADTLYTLISQHRGVALVCQSPWIVNATVRQNVTIGCGSDAKVDERAYERAIACSQLADDLRSLPAGDATASNVFRHCRACVT